VVAGDSAGGNLAASTALRARAEGPVIALQLLVYPIADHDLTRDSYVRYTDAGLILNTEEMAWFWDHYVPSVDDRDDPLVSPLRADDLSGLAPAHVILAEHDPLLDEGRAYAAALEAAGNDVTISFYPGQIHAFFSLLNILDSAAVAVEDAGRAIRAAVA
jgi:acetyl esterase